MYLEKIRLVNFRNQKDVSLSLHNLKTIITGRNGSGKTSILEAIYYACTSLSIRSGSDFEYLTYGCATNVVEAVLRAKDGEEIQMKVACRSNTRVIEKKDFYINNKKVRRYEVIGKVFILPISQDTIFKFSYSKIIRRKYFDSIISQMNSQYLMSLTLFEKVKNSRNAILKSFRLKEVDESQIVYWDKKYSQVSASVIYFRKVFIDKLNIFINKNMVDYRVNIKYITKAKSLQLDSIRNEIYDLIKASRSLEYVLGYSIIGPHRDDYEINLNDLSMKIYASRGEQKVAMSLVSASIVDYVNEFMNLSPIILIDDLESEVDNLNYKIIMDLFDKKGFQIILTSLKNNNEKSEVYTIKL